ncbi:helix-turn-helix domain-containing protein [Micromonospora sp. CPCC 206061]|uniref:helix-turn-helix domain-containing protein n=1 Tax=Micromonospora sp. CPCC 206061 TaxID=3122410 RepID=UPI002FF170B3
MEIREVDGRRATNRRGAAEYLGRSLQTVNLLASPKRKAEGSGWPDALPTRTAGQDWYALDDLDRFRNTVLAPAEAARRAKVHHVHLDGDPEELLTAKQFREIIGVEAGPWAKYVAESQPSWKHGQDGYLPLPDVEEPGRGGTIRKWKRQRVQSWINDRPGSTRGGTRRGGPTTADAVAAIASAGGHLTGTQLAEALGVPLNTAYRLLRQARAQHAANQAPPPSL